MFKLKQKTKTASLSLALAAAMTGGVMMGTSTSVQAVNIAQDGLGEVLIFPYYTVRDGWATYFNVTNTSDKTVIAKVRWREGVNSREARDFNIILSPHDVWTAATIKTETGAKIITFDNTCTLPTLPVHEVRDDGRILRGIEFTNSAFSNNNGDDHSDTIDPALRTMDRTREGYFTVFEMGVASDENSPTPVNAKHNTDAGNNTAIPFGCDIIVKQASKPEGFRQIAREFNEPQNVLRGRAVLVNGSKGVAAGYDPVVLANFYNPAGTDGESQGENLVSSPENDQPNLNSASPILASWIDDSPGVGLLPIVQDNVSSGAFGDLSLGFATASNAEAARGVDAVSALFMRKAVINDYNVATNSQTDWILSFPTKRYYVDEAASKFAGITPNTGIAPLHPFDHEVSGEKFSSVIDGKSCFDVDVKTWDREEFTKTITEIVQFSPPIPGAAGDKLCYETNVLSFKDSNIFGSSLRQSFDGLPSDNGWAEIGFNGKALPIVGMRVEFRKRGDAAENLGFANAHSYKR